jgi:hypothetical protein
MVGAGFTPRLGFAHCFGYLCRLPCTVMIFSKRGMADSVATKLPFEVEGAVIWLV